VSPAPGRLDPGKFDEAVGSDADAALAMLADMASATDPALRELARRLAGRVVLDLARGGPPRRSGVGRLARSRPSDGGDLDVDASLDELVTATAGRRPPALEELWWRKWARPATALALVVDRSGSMGGARLATAALAAAAVAWRAPDDYSVIVFADDVLVLKGQAERRPVETVVGEVLGLRGHGSTNLDAALRAAASELATSPAVHRVAVLLSDGRPTAGPDPTAAARLLTRLLVLAPRGDAAEAAALARAAGGRCEEVGGPSDVPGALARLVGA
jgi:Mg-chelatase subunit ChlD